MYRLICEGKIDVALIDNISLDDADQANAALDAWQDAETRARKKAESKGAK